MDDFAMNAMAAHSYLCVENQMTKKKQFNGAPMLLPFLMLWLQ
jgi:hypothetical protein